MPTATRDAVLTSAVDLARAAAEDVAGAAGLVGEHLGVVVEGERLISHRFAATAPGHRGWSWTVTVSRVPRGRTPTVCEVHLLPGDDAILPPPWLPWSERLRPGDVGPGDVLPLVADDDRLEQGYEAVGDADADELAIFELGLGRERVLSRRGRSEAAQRWYTGSHGPTAPQAIASSAPCSTCGFLLLLGGSLRTEFGVCANEWSPDDGRVVSMDHGCGAHSQTDVAPQPSEWPAPPPAGEELEVVTHQPPGGGSGEAPTGTVAEESTDDGSDEASTDTVTDGPADDGSGEASSETVAEESPDDASGEASTEVPDQG